MGIDAKSCVVYLVFTPLGLSRLFTVLSDNFVFVPEFLRNLENEHVCAVLEYENLKNQRVLARESPGGDGIFLRRRGGESGGFLSGEEIDTSIERMRGVITQLGELSMFIYDLLGLFLIFFVF